MGLSAQQITVFVKAGDGRSDTILSLYKEACQMTITDGSGSSGPMDNKLKAATVAEASKENRREKARITFIIKGVKISLGKKGTEFQLKLIHPSYMDLSSVSIAARSILAEIKAYSHVRARRKGYKPSENKINNDHRTLALSLLATTIVNIFESKLGDAEKAENLDHLNYFIGGILSDKTNNKLTKTHHKKDTFAWYLRKIARGISEKSNFLKGNAQRTELKHSISIQTEEIPTYINDLKRAVLRIMSRKTVPENLIGQLSVHMTRETTRVNRNVLPHSQTVESSFERFLNNPQIGCSAEIKAFFPNTPEGKAQFDLMMRVLEPMKSNAKKMKALRILILKIARIQAIGLDTTELQIKAKALGREIRKAYFIRQKSLDNLPIFKELARQHFPAPYSADITRLKQALSKFLSSLVAISIRQILLEQASILVDGAGNLAKIFNRGELRTLVTEMSALFEQLNHTRKTLFALGNSLLLNYPLLANRIVPAWRKNFDKTNASFFNPAVIKRIQKIKTSLSKMEQSLDLKIVLKDTHRFVEASHLLNGYLEYVCNRRVEYNQEDKKALQIGMRLLGKPQKPKHRLRLVPEIKNAGTKRHQQNATVISLPEHKHLNIKITLESLRYPNHTPLLSAKEVHVLTPMLSHCKNSLAWLKNSTQLLSKIKDSKCRTAPSAYLKKHRATLSSLSQTHQANRQKLVGALSKSPPYKISKRGWAWRIFTSIFPGCVVVGPIIWYFHDKHAKDKLKETAEQAKNKILSLMSKQKKQMEGIIEEVKQKKPDKRMDVVPTPTPLNTPSSELYSDLECKAIAAIKQSRRIHAKSRKTFSNQHSSPLMNSPFVPRAQVRRNPHPTSQTLPTFSPLFSLRQEENGEISPLQQQFREQRETVETIRNLINNLPTKRRIP